MNEKRFILIEGDNGTGKDTLARRLAPYGYDVVTYDADLEAFRLEAKRSPRERFPNEFLKYNRLCGERAARRLASGKKCVLVRYWPSTVAAAYADGNFSRGQALKTAAEALKSMPRPDVAFYLRCDFGERIRRIVARDPESDDSLELDRALRYEEIMNEVRLSTPSLQWEDVRSEGDVLAEILPRIR